MIKEEPLITKIIIVTILIIPLIICIVNEFKYKDLGYEEGEFTGYTLEIKGYRDIHDNIIKVKQSYNVKENDYISASLKRNIEKASDFDGRPIKDTINSYNPIILKIKQLNETDAIIDVLGENVYEQVTLKYEEIYEIRFGSDKYKIKFRKLY